MSPPAPDDAEMQQVSRTISEVLLAVLEPDGLDQESAIHAIRGLRSIADAGRVHPQVLQHVAVVSQGARPCGQGRERKQEANGTRHSYPGASLKGIPGDEATIPRVEQGNLAWRMAGGADHPERTDPIAVVEQPAGPG